jgi:2,3-diketo-5-methylthiopentyl-1-phosphate enolase
MIEAVYRFPAGVDAAKQAEMIAVGQTAGTWGARFSDRAARLETHLGRVIGVHARDDGASDARIAFPRVNTEGDIGTLLTMLFGKYSLAGPARLVELHLPHDYGIPAKFGLTGLRRLTGVTDGPLLMAIFKPALGLTAAEHAELLEEVADAGLDLIKDDEILGDLPTAPVRERVRLCAGVIARVARERGKMLLYAVNLTGRADRLNTNARELIALGANALLLNVLVYGYPALEALAADPEIRVPIFAHPALAGVLGGATTHEGDYGIAYPVLLGTLMRHAGADAVLYPASYGSLPFSAHNEFAIRQQLTAVRGTLPALMPVPSAGIHPGSVARVLSDYGDDVVLNAGGAIFDHPNGPAAGVRAFRAAIAAARAGTDVEQAAQDEADLAAALKKWGVLRRPLPLAEECRGEGS